MTGATGLIGGALAERLAAAGHEVVALRRAGGAPGNGPWWDPVAGTIDSNGIEGCEVVVHLAGAGIAGRFTARHRRAVLESRRAGTRLLCGALARLQRPPRVLVSSSASGFYGDRGDEVLDETSGPGAGFLAEVARVWEGETAVAARAGIRVVLLRTGLVLSPRGGALAPLLLPASLGLGGPLGSGRQWWSWITLADMIGAIQFALDTDALSGPVNVVAPGAARQADFARILGAVLGRPALLPAPAFALRLLLGRGMADTLILASTRVRPARLLASGYRFQHSELEPALRCVLDRGRRAA